MSTPENDILSLMHRYFAGQATVEETAALMRWCKQSTDNERIFLKERRLFDISTLHTQPEVRQSLVRLTVRKTWKWQAAAILLLALISGVAGTWLVHGYMHPSIGLTTIMVPKGQHIELCLSDDTHVWLNGGTTFTYPSAFGLGKREVTLNGEAYFQVHHDAIHPFLVNHYAGTVEVLGTTFNLVADSTKRRYETTLIEGHLLMTTNDRKALDMRSRQRAIWSDNRLTRMPYEEGNRFEWRNGLITFRQNTFAAIIEELQQTYDVAITVQKPERFTHTYTGKFRRDDGIEYALRVLQRDIPFSFRKADDGSLLIY